MNKTASQKNEILMAEAQHIGYSQRRKTLEDRCKTIVIRTPGGLDLNIGIVADGIGGANAGEAAGQMTVDSIIQYIQTTRETDIYKILYNALVTAHTNVRNSAATNVNLRTMGTTATVAIIHQGHLYLAHVGDSRAYLVREGKIQQLTLDHTWANEKVRTGQFTMAEVKNHSRKDELVRYIGAPINLEIDIGMRLDNLDPATSTLYTEGYSLKPGDTVVLCTDGLIKERRGVGGHYTEIPEIVSVVQRNSPQDAANTLVSLALGRQVDDNVSVVIMEMPGKKKKIGLPVGVNPVVIAVGAGIIGVFLMIGILLPSILTPPKGKTPTQTQGPTIIIPTPTELPGYVFVTMERQGKGKYLTPGKQPSQLPDNDYAPIENDTQINVIVGIARLDIPGGTTFFVTENSVIYINDLAQPEKGNIDTGITLDRGMMLVRLSTGKAIVKTQDGYSATVSGSIMGVQYDNGKFYVDCFEGQCIITDPKGQIVAELTGPQYRFAENGNIQEPDANSRIQLWIDALGSENFSSFGLYGTPTPEQPTPTLPPTPTEIASPTPDIKATNECGRLLSLKTPQPCPTRTPTP